MRIKFGYYLFFYIFFKGTPAEVYVYGSQWFLTGIGAMLGTLTACVIFVPFFYRLRITSIFQVTATGFHDLVRLVSFSPRMYRAILP